MLVRLLAPLQGRAIAWFAKQHHVLRYPPGDWVGAISAVPRSLGTQHQSRRTDGFG